jgi:hypothetical protein
MTSARLQPILVTGATGRVGRVVGHRSMSATSRPWRRVHCTRTGTPEKDYVLTLPESLDRFR